MCNILLWYFVPDGVYFGYPNKEKFRIWIPSLTEEELANAEGATQDYGTVGKKLFQV